MNDEDHDPLYETAIEHVVSTRKVSICRIQRVLRIGYNRAARLVEGMEADGIISAPNYRGDRSVIAKKPAA